MDKESPRGWLKSLLYSVYDGSIGCWLRNISLRHSCKRRINIYWNVLLKTNQGFSLHHPWKKKEKETASVSKLINRSSITSFITKEETVKAEIHWVLGSLPSNHSFNSCSTKTAVSAVFSGSTIAKQFSMGKIKCGYWLMEWLHTLKICL